MPHKTNSINMEIARELRSGNKMKTEPQCPKCGGKQGYECFMTETHVMGGAWDQSPAAGSHTGKAHYSKLECIECGAKFNFGALYKKGLAREPHGRRE